MHLVGGVAGRNVGGGSGRVAGAVGGAVLGGLVGAAMQDSLSTSKGLEYTVKVDIILILKTHIMKEMQLT